jgi:hypothetical protein
MRHLIHKTEKILFVFADMKETLPRASLAEKGFSFSGTLIVMKESSLTAGKHTYIFVSYYVHSVLKLSYGNKRAMGRLINHRKKSLRIISRCRCVCLS